VPGAHAYSPSTSGDRDQEDCSFKPAPGEIVRETLSWKNPSQKRAGWVTQTVRASA
jgi:hypothetical protein